MLRPLLTLLVLALGALLVAPTVLSVHDDVQNLHIHRDLPHLFKWTDLPKPPAIIPNCNDDTRDVVVTVTQWPDHIEKGQPFLVGGRATTPDGSGIGGLSVQLFLNATKAQPGEALGTTQTRVDGSYTLNATVPHELQAKHYHLVAKSESTQRSCIHYREAWSDPEMDVTARTTMTLDVAKRLMIGRTATVSGTLLDNVGGPVRDVSVSVEIDNQTYNAMTDATGRFTFTFIPKHDGPLTLVGTYGGSKYYLKSDAQASTTVIGEGLFVDGATDDTLKLTRSVAITLSGQVFLPPGRLSGNVTFTFDSIRVHACAAGCPANSTVSVTPAADGTFSTFLLADSQQPAGEFHFIGTGGGLRNATTFNGTLRIPVALTIDAHGANPFSHAVSGEARIVDDRGAPVNGTMGLFLGGADSWMPADGQGRATFSFDSPCGPTSVRAEYNGTDTMLPASAEKPLTVCPALAAFAPLGVMPWWAWILIVALPPIAYFGWRRFRDARAETIARGPPLSVAFTAPGDAAAGFVGVGEPATLTAYLEEPLPEGHRLRMGPHGALEDVEIGPDLRADITIVPDALGMLPIRAEIVDKRGRAVSRRTGHLSVVRYAEDIERRYRALKRRSVGADEERISPRGFEAWLRERAPDVDPSIAARLIAIFEEADYGPRDAGRRELLAYIEAEAATQEVAPHAN